jgi:hypothetical protein
VESALFPLGSASCFGDLHYGPFPVLLAFLPLLLIGGALFWAASRLATRSAPTRSAAPRRTRVLVALWPLLLGTSAVQVRISERCEGTGYSFHYAFGHHKQNRHYLQRDLAVQTMATYWSALSSATRHLDPDRMRRTLRRRWWGRIGAAEDLRLHAWQSSTPPCTLWNRPRPGGHTFRNGGQCPEPPSHRHLHASLVQEAQYVRR